MSVDRNAGCALPVDRPLVVALRKESVDRNTDCESCWFGYIVALRKESVDRNCVKATQTRSAKSLSARRAWIEICAQPKADKGAEGRSPQGERG